MGLGTWPKVCKWHHVHYYNVYQHLVEHLQVLQVRDSLRLMVEKVDPVDQVVEMDQNVLAAWALRSEDGEAEDHSSQDENNVIAQLVSVS